MNRGFGLLPEEASTAASRTDALFLFLCAVTAFFTVLIFALILYYAIRNRRRSAVAPPVVKTNYTLEVLWTVIPLILTMVIFFWGARIYFFIYRPPDDAIDIHVIGKQWMWKIQHPNGRREINELHIPVHRAVKLTLASQDVIHSFFVPAFRIKQDAVPGRYTVLWFEATRVGQYHLFCAEYCGTNHSAMIGRVVVMENDRYQAWLTGTPVEETPEEAGKAVFDMYRCSSCHGVQAPTLAGLFGSVVRLSDGSSVRADEAYLRESILDSTAKIVAGYAPIMPSFRGQITEEQLMDLIAYVRSLERPSQVKKAEQ